MNTNAVAASGAPALPVRIKVVGVGGAGINALEPMQRLRLRGVELVAIHTDDRVLSGSGVESRMLLGITTTRGLGAAGDPETGREAAEQDADRLRALCVGSDLVFIVAGLGRGTGTGASPVLARVAKQTGALVLGVVTLPFTCEGPRRERQAQRGLRQLQAAADGVICVPNQRVAGLVDGRTSLNETFRVINDWLAQGVQGIWRLLVQPGLITVNFADLCGVLRGRHTESSLAAVEATGEHRLRELVERLRSHPLLDEGRALDEAEALLVSVTAGPDLTLREVDWIMEQVHHQSERAQVVLGIGTDEQLQGRIAVTLIAAGRSRLEAAEGPAGGGVGGEEAGEGRRGGGGADVESAGPTRTPARSRFAPAAPELSADETAELLVRQQGPGRGGKAIQQWRQGLLPLEIVHKGRFAKSEPTIHQGEDLDVPTYIRRGVPLN